MTKELSEEDKALARQCAIDVLMPRLLAFKDWQADKKDRMKARIAQIKAHMGDELPEVQSAMLAIERTKK